MDECELALATSRSSVRLTCRRPAACCAEVPPCLAAAAGHQPAQPSCSFRDTASALGQSIAIPRPWDGKPPFLGFHTNCHRGFGALDQGGPATASRRLAACP